MVIVCLRVMAARVVAGMLGERAYARRYRELATDVAIRLTVGAAIREPGRDVAINNSAKPS
jgi:hypothetical protein